MHPPKLAILPLLAMAAAAAELPDLRIEPTAGGSIFYVKNSSTQPLTGWLIELVDYPGSSFSLWQDDPAVPLAPGAERRIPVTNMTVGGGPRLRQNTGCRLRRWVYRRGSRKSHQPHRAPPLYPGHDSRTDPPLREDARSDGTYRRPEGLARLYSAWAACHTTTINQAAGQGVIQDAISKLRTEPVTQRAVNLEIHGATARFQQTHFMTAIQTVRLITPGAKFFRFVFSSPSSKIEITSSEFRIVYSHYRLIFPIIAAAAFTGCQEQKEDIGPGRTACRAGFRRQSGTGIRAYGIAGGGHGGGFVHRTGEVPGCRTTGAGRFRRGPERQ